MCHVVCEMWWELHVCETWPKPSHLLTYMIRLGLKPTWSARCASGRPWITSISFIGKLDAEHSGLLRVPELKMCTASAETSTLAQTQHFGRRKLPFIRGSLVGLKSWGFQRFGRSFGVTGARLPIRSSLTGGPALLVFETTLSLLVVGLTNLCSAVGWCCSCHSKNRNLCSRNCRCHFLNP